MRNKVKTLEEAAAAVRNGDRVVMTANMLHPPMALLRHVVRQGTRDLRVIGLVNGAINVDFLVGAGAAAVVDTASISMGEFARTGPNFSRYLQAGRVKSLDNT